MSANEPLFSSAEAAIVFALNHSAQAYDRPVMSRMASPAIGNGKGLGGIDGAAQAGMIRQEMRLLGPLAEACIIARFAPRGIPCECRSPCCSGWRNNKEREEAIGFITDRAMAVLSGCVSNYRLRRGIVEKAFGAKVTLTEMAEYCGVDPDTAGRQHAHIVTWIKGAKAKGGNSADRGVERAAMDAIADRLRDAEIVGILTPA